MLSRDQVVQSYQRNGGNITTTAKELNIGRGSVYHHLKKAGINRKKKIAEGNVEGIKISRLSLPPENKIQRYILTSAQNNTHVNLPVWENLKALADYYGAKILVGTFSYNQSAYGPMSVKRGTSETPEKSLWYSPEILDYVADQRIELAEGLQWCGEMNILPTAVNPLSGFETYTGSASSIFPQVKFAMRSIPSGKHEPTKFMYTTGTVTKRNYIQKREGLKAEHHHCYGGLMVEVNHTGGWWVRQLNANKTGTIYDLDVFVENKEVKKHTGVEAITWGDTHALLLDKNVFRGMQAILEELKPKNQFVHDVMLGSVTNHHSRKSTHERFRRFSQSGGWNDLGEEIKCCVKFLQSIHREYCKTFVVDSNHDRPWLERWLDLVDGREDPKNALLWLDLNAAMFRAIQEDPFKKNFHVLEHACQMMGLSPEQAKFLREDESVLITRANIECGMHGHLGPNGCWGSVNNISRIPKKSNIGHCHKAGIYDGVYAAGVSCETDSEAWYTRGPSSWSHSHVITYPNGKRTIVTMREGEYRGKD